MVLVEWRSCAKVLAWCYSSTWTHIKEQLTASHPSFPLPSHLDNPLIPPIHLNDTIRRYGTLERMAVGEGDEEVRWSIRVLGVDVFQSWEIAMVIVIV
jgi:hypothetical protein